MCFMCISFLATFRQKPFRMGKSDEEIVAATMKAGWVLTDSGAGEARSKHQE